MTRMLVDEVVAAASLAPTGTGVIDVDTGAAQSPDTRSDVELAPS